MRQPLTTTDFLGSLPSGDTGSVSPRKRGWTKGQDPREGLNSLFRVDCYQGCWLCAHSHTFKNKLARRKKLCKHFFLRTTNTKEIQFASHMTIKKTCGKLPLIPMHFKATYHSDHHGTIVKYLSMKQGWKKGEGGRSTNEVRSTKKSFQMP